MEEVAFTRKKMQEIPLNIAPLVDIVLLLLIFFILSSSFIISRGIQVNLPDGTGQQQLDRKKITISVTKNNQLFLGNKKISFTDLKKALPKGCKLFIDADKHVNIGLIVKIMEVGRKMKAKAIVISTKAINDHK